LSNKPKGANNVQPEQLLSSNVTFRLSQRHPPLAVAVCLFGLTQIIGYGTLYYGPPL
jgi:hypothetical protein